MPYLQVSGLETYHEVVGVGPPLLLLHGGFCSIETERAQIESLSRQFRVYAPERPGQGRTADRDGPITFDGILADTVAYLDAEGLRSAHVIGFSDGAIAGLLLAMRHPTRVRSLVAISANLDPSGLVDEEADGASAQQRHPELAPEAMLNVDARMRADYDRLSPDGSAHAEVVLEKLLRLWREEPQIRPASLAAVVAPTLVMAGDHDSIRTDHTVSIAAAIPGAQLCILPGTGHGLLWERPDLVNRIVRDFILACHA